MKFKKLLISTIILGIFTACSSQKEDEKEISDNNVSPQASLSQGQSMSFDLNFLEGESLHVKSDSGKINFDNEDKATLFVFFTTWCAPCIAEIPHLNKLQEKYKDSFNVIGILLEDKNEEEINLFKENNKIAYKIANGENNYLFARAMGGINGIPSMFLYAKNGDFVNQYLGIIPGEMLEIEILKATL